MRSLFQVKWLAAFALILGLGASIWLLGSRRDSATHLLSASDNQSPWSVYHDGQSKGARAVTEPATTIPRAVNQAMASDSGMMKSNLPSPAALNSFSLQELWRLYSENSGIETDFRALAAKRISFLIRQSGTGAPRVLREIRASLLDEQVDERERAGFVQILAEANTADALLVLLDAEAVTQSDSLRRSIIEQINRMGPGKSSEQGVSMTEVAIDAWRRHTRQVDAKSTILIALAAILAKQGDATGLAFLRDQAIRGGSKIADLAVSGQYSAVAAMNASWEVSGQNALPLLSRDLLENDPKSTKFIWSGQALTSMGRAEATSVLIEWAKLAPDSCSETAAAWIGAVRDSRSHALVCELAASGAQMQFVSERVKQAVLNSANKLATQ